MRKTTEKKISFILAAVFLSAAMSPMTVLAQERQSAAYIHNHEGTEAEGGGCYTLPILHQHTGTTEDGEGCYGKAVYHTHSGSPEEGGGCYGETVFHKHKGSSSQGGECYQTPVYHSHEGSESGGGCYTVPVCHTHSGTASGGGGCYTVPVRHTHTGSASGGGGCYTVPVCHTHTGSPSGGGGCYTVPVRHTHTGSAESGGGCYVTPVYHVHTDACYTEKEQPCHANCISYNPTGESRDTYCFHHGPHVEYEAKCVVDHSACGRERVEETLWDGCDACGNRWVYSYDHTYMKKELSCGKTDKTIESYQLGCGKKDQEIESYNLGCGKKDQEIESYQLGCGKKDQEVESYKPGCGKNEQTVEHYRPGCGKDSQTIEFYELSCDKTIEGYKLNCQKTENTVEYYELNCGKTEETVEKYETECGMDNGEEAAALYLEPITDKWVKELELQASYTAKDDVVDENVPFIWNGKASADVSYKVTENGMYTVALNKKENPYLFGFDLKLQTQIANIDRTGPAITAFSCDETENLGVTELHVSADDLQPDGTKGCGLDSEPYSWDGGRSFCSADSLEVSANGTYEIVVRDALGNETRADIEVSTLDTGAPTVEIVYDQTPGIDKTKLIIKADDTKGNGKPGSGLPADAISWDKGKTWGNEVTKEIKENGTYEVWVRDNNGNIAKAKVIVENLKEEPDTGNNGSGGKEENTGGDNHSGNGDADGDDSSDNDNTDSSDAESSGMNDGSSTEESQDENETETEQKTDAVDENDSAGKKDAAKKENDRKKSSGRVKADKKKNGGKTILSGGFDTEEENEGEDTEKETEKTEETEEMTMTEETVTETVNVEEMAENSGEPAFAEEMPAQENTFEMETFGEGAEKGDAGKVKPAFLQTKTGRTLAVLAGAAAVVSAIGAALYFLLLSVRVYNYNGCGKYHYVGSIFLHREDEGFQIRLTGSMTENADTKEYRAKTGWIFRKVHAGEEMIVVSDGGKRKSSVTIGDNMEFSC